jgi:hypothetical protein
MMEAEKASEMLELGSIFSPLITREDFILF